MNLIQKITLLLAALVLGACANKPITETRLHGVLAKQLEEKTPAALRETRSRSGGTDINDPFRLTTVTDWCELSLKGECQWRTTFNSFTYDPFVRAFVLGFTGGGFVGLTQLGGVTYAAKKSATNCSPSALFCNGTMINVEGSQASAGSESSSAATSTQGQEIRTQGRP